MVLRLKSSVGRDFCFAIDPEQAATSILTERLLIIELQVTLEPSGMDLAPVNRVFDRALGFVGVRAVRELTEWQVRPKFDEMTAQFGRDDAPEFELS